MFFVDGIHKLNCEGLEIAASVPCELPKTMFSASIKKNNKRLKMKLKQCLASKVVKIVVSYLARRVDRKREAID
jgi:hypothetical protein